MNQYSEAQIEEVSKLNSEAAVLECQLAAKTLAIERIAEFPTQHDPGEASTGVE